MTLREGWETFLKMVDNMRPRVEDRWVPVALVCLQATPVEGGELDVLPDADPLIMWPKDVPVNERGPLLAKIAERYKQGTVLRSDDAR